MLVALGVEYPPGSTAATDTHEVMPPADTGAMDSLAAMLNSYDAEVREWDHAEICNQLVVALRETGRTVHLVDDAEESARG